MTQLDLVSETIKRAMLQFVKNKKKKTFSQVDWKTWKYPEEKKVFTSKVQGTE